MAIKLSNCTVTKPIQKMEYFSTLNADSFPDSMINTPNQIGQTPLHWLSNTPNDTSDLIRSLINRGADINIKDKKMNTPLHLAVTNNNFTVTKLLLDSDAYVNAFDKDGSTALHIACKNGYESIAQLLIDAKININAIDFGRLTALMVACLRCETKCIKLLINSKADTYIKDGADWMAANYIAYAECDLQTINDIIQLFIDAGFDINSINTRRLTVLHCALACKNYTVAKSLIDFRCDVNIRNNTNKTALKIVASHEYSNETCEIIDMLVNAGADDIAEVLEQYPNPHLRMIHDMKDNQNRIKRANNDAK